MNKEEARNRLEQVLSNGRLELVGTVDPEILEVFDSIEPDHKPVPLPQIVGEQWDGLNEHYPNITGAINALIIQVKPKSMYDDLLAWFVHSSDSITTLVQAGLYGWAPEPETLFVLPMVKAKSSNLYAFKDRDENWDAGWDTKNINSLGKYCLVTQSDIDSAPAWVKAIKPVEVTEDDD